MNNFYVQSLYVFVFLINIIVIVLTEENWQKEILHTYIIKIL